jgi:hypothetical protein
MRKIISAVHRVSHSRSFEVIRGHQHTNQACGHQRSSEVIRGHPRTNQACGA